MKSRIIEDNIEKSAQQTLRTSFGNFELVLSFFYRLTTMASMVNYSFSFWNM
jgi:hypothetical protein